VHFGAGQTEAEIALTPGQHVLQLILGDRNHVPHSPPVASDRITITVVPDGAAVPDAANSPQPTYQQGTMAPQNTAYPQSTMAPHREQSTRAPHREPPAETGGRRVPRTPGRQGAGREPHRRVQSARRGDDDAPVRVRSGPPPKYEGPCRIDLGYGRYEPC